MKGYWFLPICICFSSCMVSNGLEYESMSETNIYHITRVRKGMSERQVLQIMHKPYSYETFEVEDDIYDVWFYVTRVTGLDQTRMVPQNLTPLTFKNGILVGTGYYWYYYAMKEQVGELAAQKPEVEKPKTQEAEDTDFEKTLRTQPQKAAPSSPNGIQKTLEKGKQEKLPPNVRIVSNHENLPNRFSSLFEGMTESDVINIAGEPVQFETFQMGIDVFDVWYYAPNLPLTFKNAVLISMSDGELQQLKEKVVVGSPVPTFNPETSSCPCPERHCGSDRFSFLSKGMSETEVMNILGEPMKYETFQLGCDVFDVWFYDTIASKSGKPSIIPQNTTPLTFRNAVLISMSDEEFFRLKERATATATSPAAVEPPIAPIQEKKSSIFKPYVPKTPLGVTQKVFSKVKKGMTGEEVMDLIGSTMNQESISVNSDVYDIWFYDVGSKKKMRKVPLTFKNGVLVGMTEADYNKIKEQADSDNVRGYNRTGERMEEDESEQNFDYW